MHKAQVSDRSWDYLYEPDARMLLDGVLRRYVEALVFQMVNENMASEQSARMVAMRAASDNAGKIINELEDCIPYFAKREPSSASRSRSACASPSPLSATSS